METSTYDPTKMDEDTEQLLAGWREFLLTLNERQTRVIKFSYIQTLMKEDIKGL